MSLNVIWSPKALKTYNNTITYLAENWTDKEVQNFIDRTEIVIKYISQNHSLYPYSEHSNSYRAVIIGK